MLKDREVMATIPVKNADRAQTFYEDTLGLTRLPGDAQGVLEFKAGGSKILVYESEFAGTNEATAATWVVGDELDTIVRTLKGKGVEFEHYDDMPGIKRQGDVHLAGGMKSAWFKDPDGNIISIVNGRT